MIKVEYDRYREEGSWADYIAFRCPICEEHYEVEIEETGEPPFVWLCENCGEEFEVS